MVEGKVQENRQSHENESVKKLYDNFLKKPLGHSRTSFCIPNMSKEGLKYPMPKNKKLR